MDNLVYNWIPSSWNELYYSVQSMKRYLIDLDKIYILTNHDLPFEDEQVIRVPIVEEKISKEYIIVNNVRQFCEMGLCDDFIYLSDDHFALREFSRSDLLPPMALEDLKDVAYWDDSLSYWDRLLYSTMVLLEENGYPTLNYASHSPEYFECDKFLKTVEVMGTCQFQIQSAYLNMWSDGYRFLKDNMSHNKVFTRPMKYKIIDILTRNNRFFCVADGALNDDMKNFIQKNFTFCEKS